MNLGIFGGAFDPVHLGHLRLAFYAYETLQLERICFVPTYIPAHKSMAAASAKHRLQMLSLALTDQIWATIDECEIDRKETSYTIDTLQMFQKKHPLARLHLIIGEDSLNQFTSWYKYKEILDFANLVVMPRIIKKTNIANYKKSLADKVYMLSAQHINISSSAIRQLLAEKKSPKYLVPDNVLAYIKDMELYEFG